MHRSKMSQGERALRSRLAQWVRTGEFVRGTLSVRERVCGKPNCRCARGEKHVSLCLVRSKDGRIEQLHIPHEWEDEAKQWVERYRQMRQHLEKISDMHWERLKERKE
jgi:hypothetical protein